MALEHLTTVDFDEKVNEAPLSVVDFWASWCGPCKMMGPVVDQLAEDYSGKALVAKVNIDEEPELTQRFEILYVPTLVFLKNGQEFDRKVGIVPPTEFTSVLDANL